MLKELINDIAEHYLDAKTSKNERVANLLKKQAPVELQKHLASIQHELLPKGSHGNGNWSAVPWFAVFEPTVTTSAQRGYYVVYLFSADMKHLYLSMNQGATKVQEEFGAQAHEILRARASILRARAPQFKKSFSSDPIDLGSNRNLPSGYEAGHTFGKEYALPLQVSEAELAQDLQAIVKLYLEIIGRGGLELPVEVEDSQSDNDDWTSSEKPRYRQHRTLERNRSASKKAKQCHGTVCQGCGFDFSKKYGVIGDGYIEAHHLTPISELPKDLKTDLNVKEHFAVLCANCHRMMHRKNGPKTIRELKAILQ